MPARFNNTDVPTYPYFTPEATTDNEFILQVCFGIFGAIGTFITLAGLHYRDSLGCMLLRHRLSRRQDDRECSLIFSRLSVLIETLLTIS